MLRLYTTYRLFNHSFTKISDLNLVLDLKNCKLLDGPVHKSYVEKICTSKAIEDYGNILYAFSSSQNIEEEIKSKDFVDLCLLSTTSSSGVTLNSRLVDYMKTFGLKACVFEDEQGRTILVKFLTPPNFFFNSETLDDMFDAEELIELNKGYKR